jgi:hypothetical protein
MCAAMMEKALNTLEKYGIAMMAIYLGLRFLTMIYFSFQLISPETSLR